MTRPTFHTQDEKSRESIVLDIDKNLFVEAGAGSGKTTMLVNRMVAMIESGIEIDKICAITFTKNAALEFYDRFQEKLIIRSNPKYCEEPKRAGDLNKPTDETRKRCAKALENIDLCFMGTIDSFCNMILSEHPSEANIPTDAKLINQEEEIEIYKQFYVECMHGDHGEDIRQLAKRFSMLFWSPEEKFSILMSEIMNRRNVKFIVDDNLCIDFFKCFKKQRDDMKKVLKAFNKDLTKITIPTKNEEDLDPIEDIYLPASNTLQKGWHYNYQGVQNALKKISEMTYEATLSEIGLSEECVVRQAKGTNKIELNIKEKDNKDALLFKLNDYKYQNSLKFVLSCVELLEEKMRNEGKFTFFDYLYYLRNMLEKDSKQEGKLINYIYNRHSYFLIDEFQDTNPLQTEIFFYLSAIDPKQKSWRDCKPKHGSLFIVGDPKQSIYKFRSADVSSYLNTKKMFNDEYNEVKYLVNNYRSKNEIKTYFNTVFNDLMADEKKEQSKYLDIDNTSDVENNEQKKELRGIYTYEAYSLKLQEDYPEMIDQKQIASIIKRLVNNPNYQIIGENKKLRTIDYKDFMVIFSQKKNIAPCIKEFKVQDIPTRVEGKVLFEECESLITISNIYQAITNKNDKLSLISALYSPVFGFNENDIADYKYNGGEIKLNPSFKLDKNPVYKAILKLTESSKTISKLTPSTLFEKIMEDYEIFKYITTDNLEIVYFVLELLRQEETNGNIITYEDAINYINELLSGESDNERCLSLKQDENAVHIANLHKVKGLEAPIVILAKSGNSNKGAEIRIEYDNDGAKGYIVSIGDKGDYSFNSLISTNTLEEKNDLEKESVKLENDRLVYVASTRARNVLIVNDPKRSRSGKVINGNGWSKWKILKEHINEDFFKVIGENPNYKEPEFKEVKADDLYKSAKIIEINTKESYSFKQPSDIQTPPKTSELPYENEGMPIGNGETYATLMGTMVHRLMEMIIMSKNNISKDDAINNILNEYVTEEFTDNLDLFKQKLNNVYDVMHNGGFPQKGKAQQDILPVILSADKHYSEVPFTLKDSNNLWNGIIDLIYEKDGKLHIIDWKTNKDDEGLDKHYKDQLNAYIQATKLTLGKDVEDALIYHIDIKN